MSKAVTIQHDVNQEKKKTETDLAEAREELLEAEARLAREQAAVNAFRMQCRLKLGDLIEEALDLRARRESCLTRLKLVQQEVEPSSETKTADPFALEDDEHLLETGELSEIVLPELVTPQQEKEAARRLYRELARRFHPDLAAGSAERAYMTAIMASINSAYEQRNLTALHNLAGELDPTAVAELESIDNLQIRRLRKQLLKIQRRQRKVLQQYLALRSDNVTRLWRKAQRLEKEGKSWWKAVRRDLQHIIERTRTDLIVLEAQLALFDESEKNM